MTEWYFEDGYIKRRSIREWLEHEVQPLQGRSIREWLEYEVQLLQAAGINPVRLGDGLLIFSEACGKPVKLLVKISPEYPYEPPKAFYSFDGESFKHLCYMRKECWLPFQHTLAFVFMQSLAILRQALRPL